MVLFPFPPAGAAGWVAGGWVAAGWVAGGLLLPVAPLVTPAVEPALVSVPLSVDFVSAVASFLGAAFGAGASVPGLGIGPAEVVEPVVGGVEADGAFDGSGTGATGGLRGGGSSVVAGGLPGFFLGAAMGGGLLGSL
jgi:hypothetical protein